MIKSTCIAGFLTILLVACACTETGEITAPIGGMIFVKAEGKALMGISPEVRGYGEVKTLLGGAGHHEVSVAKWEKVKALID